MKNLGRIEDPKDIITKEFLEEGIGAKVNTLEDNLQMAESDIDSLQTDVQGLQTDNTATKAAVKTLQDTYVPNTRKVNNKALDADITLTANDVGTVPATWHVTGTSDEIDRLLITGGSYEGANAELGILYAEDGYYYGTYLRNSYIKTLRNGIIEVSAEPTTDMGIVNKEFLESNIRSIPIPDIKVVTNVSCPLSAWVSDTTTYTDYQFKADLTVADATADYIPLVNFAPSEQESGNYIGATSGSGIVTIWCKSKPSGTITIPNIILTKEN